MKMKVLFFMCLPFFAACSKTQPIVFDQETPQLQIDKQLNENITVISKEVSELREELNRGKPRTEAVKKAARQKLTVPAGSVLGQKKSVNWIGNCEPLLKLLAKDLGYKFKTIGTKGITDHVVKIKANDLRYIDILEDIGWQLSPVGMGLKINEKNKEILLIKE